MIKKFHAMMVSVLGANWFMRLCGILELVETVAEQVLQENPIPTNPTEWKVFGGKVFVGVVMLKTKGSSVTNSPDPHKPTVLTPELAAKPNPAALVPCLLLLMVMMGCSAAEIQKANHVLVKLKADATTVAIVGCAHAPAVQIATGQALELLPPGTTIDQLQSGLTLAEPQVADFCRRLQALTPPAPAMPGAAGLS